MFPRAEYFDPAVNRKPTTMLDLYKQSVLAQFEAVLSTLRQCLVRCPEECWTENVGNFPFWHVAYHALYYGDFYATSDFESFQPQSFHREHYNYFDKTPEPPHTAPVVDIPYERDVLLGYVDHCRGKAARVMAAETAESLAGPSGFPWYKVTRAEFWLINQRHVYHHVAQLALMLRNKAGVAIDWIGHGWKA